MSDKSPDLSVDPVTDQDRFEELFSQGSLRRTWIQVRKELRKVELRDVVDWLDWAALIDGTLPRIRKQVISGDYQPMPPARYELAKRRGAFRYMTIPSVRDSLVFRHISDAALERAAPFAIEGAYFSRRHAANPVGRAVEPNDDDYEHFFDVWIRYNNYRTRTLLSDIYEVLVVTDISNYFDSIEHDLLLEYLAPLGLPRKAVGVLGKLLEVLKPTAGHSPNPRVGLPVDELDCSRQLAHIFLFEHDRSVNQTLSSSGGQRYVRWMDDQNIGAESLTDARKIINLLTRSLQRQRLTLNAGKTLFLSPPEVVIHFHLDTNSALDEWNERWRRARYSPVAKARKELLEIWQSALLNESQGNWDKILKRFYAYVVPANAAFLDVRAYDDVVAHPAIAPRIFMSFVKRGRVKPLLDVFAQYVGDNESMFEATEAAFFDALLSGNVGAANERRSKAIVLSYLDNSLGNHSKGQLGRSVAILTYYWFGGNAKDLHPILTDSGWSALSPQVGRTILATSAARAPRRFKELAIQFVGNPSDDIARLTEFIGGILAGEVGKLSFPFANLKPRWPLPGQHYDARAWLQLEILSRSKDPFALPWIKKQVAQFEKYADTRQEKRVLGRIRNRTNP